MRLLPVAIALAALSASADAQTSEEYAQMSKLSWSAFECAALASSAGETEQEQRLFKLGYDRGKTFLDAAFAGKIEQRHLLFIVPVGFSLRMEGPTSDFVLGRVWEGATDDALKAVHQDERGEPVSSDLWQMRAQTEFRRKNCELI
jgi:hypothetical protein